MCGSAPEIDDTPQRMQKDAAAEARAREDARQKRIQTGRGMLDSMFEGGTFIEPGQWAEAVNRNEGARPGSADWQVQRMPGDEVQEFEGYQPYLDDRRDTLMSFYMPQFQEQQQDAQDRLTFDHARAGTLQSSMAADNVADLSTTADRERTSLLGDIDSDISQTRGRFEDTRMGLEDMLASTGDAERTFNTGLSQLTNLFHEKPQQSRLGDVFANAVGGIGQYGQGRQQGRVAGIYNQPNIASRAVPGGAGGASGRVVR